MFHCHISYISPYVCVAKQPRSLNYPSEKRDGHQDGEKVLAELEQQVRKNDARASLVMKTFFCFGGAFWMKKIKSQDYPKRRALGLNHASRKRSNIHEERGQHVGSMSFVAHGPGKRDLHVSV